MISEQEIIDKIIPYFHKYFVRVDREVKTVFGVIDLYIPENDTVIEVKKDCRNLQRAFGQLLTYGRAVYPSSNRKKVLIYNGRVPDRWHNIFHDYKIEVFHYQDLVEDKIPISEFGIYTKNTEFWDWNKATQKYLFGNK